MRITIRNPVVALGMVLMATQPSLRGDGQPSMEGPAVTLSILGDTQANKSLAFL